MGPVPPREDLTINKNEVVRLKNITYTDCKHEIQGDKIITTFSYSLPPVEYVNITFSFKVDKITTALGNKHYAKNGKLYRKAK